MEFFLGLCGEAKFTMLLGYLWVTLDTFGILYQCITDIMNNLCPLPGQVLACSL